MTHVGSLSHVYLNVGPDTPLPLLLEWNVEIMVILAFRPELAARHRLDISFRRNVQCAGG
jgi:hypothetical protein